MSDLATGTADLEWNVSPSSIVTAVAVLGVSAVSVRVTVMDGATTIYDEERAMVDNSAVGTPGATSSA